MIDGQPERPFLRALLRPLGEPILDQAFSEDGAPIELSASVRPGAYGLLVQGVEGPAIPAGFQEDDVVVAIDGQTFYSLDNFSRLLRPLRPGDEVSLTVIRGDSVVEVQLTLAAR